jgi:putative membrane protein
MKHTGSWAVVLAAAGILAFDIGAFAQTQHGTQPKSEMSQTTKSEAQDKSATSRYIRQASMSGMFEVEAGKLALIKARNNAVKDFARQMVNDHTDWNKKLENAVAEGKVATKPAAKLDAEHQKKLDQLKSADTARFDRLYMDTQVKGHNQALALHKGYAANGDVEPLKNAAGELVPMVQHHLDMANKVASGIASPTATNSNRTTGLPRKGS